MDVSPAAVADATQQLQKINQTNEVRVNVFKKALDIQADTVSQLLNSVPDNPPLATSGTLGTKLNVYA